jgi:hypothetical protein
MTAFLVILLLFGIAVILYAVALALRHIFSTASKSVAANLAISRAQILIERQQMEEKKAQAKKAREASKVLSPLHFSPLQPWQLYRRIPKGQDPLASLSQEQKDAWLRDLVKKTSEPPIPSPIPSPWNPPRQADGDRDGDWFGEVFWGIAKLAFGWLALLAISESIDQAFKHYHNLAEPSSAAGTVPEPAAVQVPAQGDSFDRAFAAQVKADGLVEALNARRVAASGPTPLPLDNGVR